LKKKIYLIILVLFSIFINQYAANRGVFPIDSFLIFDAAYNVISGNHPFKDYWLITGPFLDYIQSLFFLIFGINWVSYLLHASFLNVLLVLFSFYYFIKIGLNNFYSFLYSLGVAVLAYPSIGTPFIDHHAVILCMMASLSISLAILLKKNIFWILAPIFIIFSFFSKQIPSPYFATSFFIILSIHYYFLKNFNKSILLNLLAGVLFSIFLVISIFIINEIPLENFLVQYILYPLSFGKERINLLDFDFKNLVGQFKFIYLSIIPLIFITYILIKNKNKNLIKKNDITISILFLSSVAILIYNQLLTKNQILIYFIIPIAAAHSHAYSIKYFNKKYLTYFVIVIFMFSSVKYHVRFNEERKFIELASANFDLAQKASLLDKRLIGLQWITPHYPNNPLKEINILIETKNILIKKVNQKIIITDYQFLSSLINNQFASTNKWYDSLSIPRKKNKYYDRHKIFFYEQIKKNNIKHLFFIGKNKSKMPFFKEFFFENKCIILNDYNDLLLEFDISECKF